MIVHMLASRTAKDFATKCGMIASMPRSGSPDWYTVWAHDVDCPKCLAIIAPVLAPRVLNTEDQEVLRDLMARAQPAAITVTRPLTT